MTADMGMAKRLKEARELAGYRTASEAAAKLRLKEQTYLAHENGSRGFTKKAPFYSAKYSVNLEWLVTGRGLPSANKVAVVGYVGAGQKIIPIDDHMRGAGLDSVEAPPGAKATGLAAVKVRGDSMYPAYQDGDVILYGEHEPPAELIGREVVVKTVSEEMFIKHLETGSKPGCYTLRSYNATPLRDVEILWAARVRYIVKA
jgi:phage repressor protein C with HTH and peptisase S24 domain